MRSRAPPRISRALVYEAIACAFPATVAWLTWFVILVVAVPAPFDFLSGSANLVHWFGGGFVGLVALWSRVLRPGGTGQGWLRSLQLIGLVIGLTVAGSLMFPPRFESLDLAWWLYAYVCVSASLGAVRHIILILKPRTHS